MKERTEMDVQGWLEAIRNITQELGWKVKVQSQADRTLAICPLPSDRQFKGVFFVVSSVARRVVVYVNYRVRVAPDRLIAMSELVSRVNAGIIAGCLELDWEDREVRYRDGFYCVSAQVDGLLLKSLVATALQDSVLYCAAVEAVAEGSTPASALETLGNAQ